MEMAKQQLVKHNGGDLPAGPQAGVLDCLIRDSGRFGFHLVRRSAEEAILEAAGLRLRLLAMPDGRCTVQGSLPREAHVAEFLLEDNDKAWWTGIENGRIVRCTQVDSEAAGIAAIRALSSVVALTTKKDDKQPCTFLRKLGKRQWQPSIPDAWFELGCDLLSHTRALAVRGGLVDCWAWLARVTPGCNFAVRSELLQSQPDKVAEFLRETSATLNGACLVLNLGVVNDAWRTIFLETLMELHEADATAGARVLFLSSTALPSDIPTLELPDFHTVADCAAQGDTPALRRIMTREGGDADMADALLKRARHAAASGPSHGTTVVRPATSGVAHVERIRHWVHLLTEGFIDVVGHVEVKQTLARTIALWMAQDDDGPPLVLAFAGPSGAGKNMLAERIATVFSSEEFFHLKRADYVTINMGTPGDSKQWSLTGVGAGHVGADRKGLLEATCEHAGYVITFDEIDKCIANGPADPQGFLVSVLENAGFRNGHGNWVPLAKGIIILTLNCGVEAAGEQFKPMGFGAQDRANARQAWVESRYRDYYEKNLIAPLRGRIHRPFFFGELTSQDLRQLARRELERLHAADAALGLAWTRTDLDAISDILAKAVDPSQGARALMRELKRFHEQELNALLGLAKAKQAPIKRGDNRRKQQGKDKP